ncbi:toll-like receptor 2 type-1 isoform X2 [Rhynchophorus ferrugineus]|uniref:toll-like receptor 2 type-1 isoform X2 n=1 Tax=Rhynchophorus ferrugineus TaxID=354439 RepID=UPI003FCCE6BD
MLHLRFGLVILTALWLMIICISKTSSNCGNQKCKTVRIHGLKSSDCFGMDWKEFPKCLSSDVEVIDLSYNRIRKISRSDFQKHSHLKYLYLADNLITKIEDDTLADLGKLETLDLSLNGLGKIPPGIFQLPSLKMLYLSKNTNLNISETIDTVRPITSPITKLDISQITSENESRDFPNFGEMPFLAILNISGNQFNYLMPKHFAGLCNLELLDNKNVTTSFKSYCDCLDLNKWLEERNVKFTQFHCYGQHQDCLNRSIDQTDLDTYTNCLKQKDHLQQIKIFSVVGIVIAVFLIILIVISVILYKRYQKRKQRNASVKMTVAWQSGRHLLR